MRGTAAQRSLRGTRLAQTVEHSAPELPDVIGAAIGQRKLCGVPSGLDRIELGSVGWQALQMQPRVFPAEITQGPRIMNGGAVPHHDDVTAQVAQQVPQEVVDLIPERCSSDASGSTVRGDVCSG